MLRRSFRRYRVAFVSLAIIALAAVVLGDRPQLKSGRPTKEDSPRQTKLRKLIDESIHWYQLFPAQNSSQLMQPQLVLRWPNNTRGSDDGATVIWIADGRPEAVAAIYPWQDLFCLEFDSLSRGAIVAKHDGLLVWQPTAAGIEFHRIARAPTPASSPAARRRQMKALVQRFRSPLLGWQTDNSQWEELRLMPSPIYRYKIEQPAELLDGALFAFASGTDPESLLVIEAVRGAPAYHWEYAFARRSSGGLEGRLDEQLVWTAKRYPAKKNPSSQHIQFNRPLDLVLPSR